MKETGEYEVIKTIGENGEEVDLKLVEIVTVNEKDYALLTSADVDIENDEDGEIVLMRIVQNKNSDYAFETIEDDEEFELVSSAIMDDETEE